MVWEEAHAQRVLLAAIENGAHKTPEHLAKQPFGVIPALQDEGLTVYESRAIARYVDLSRGGKLVPNDAKQRAIMEQWISLEQGTITPEISGIVSQRIFAPMFGGVADEAVVKEHYENAKLVLDILDLHLSKNQYLAGPTFSLADVFMMPYFALAHYTPEKDLLESRPNISAWWKRVTSRPSWAKVQTYNEFNQKQ